MTIASQQAPPSDARQALRDVLGARRLPSFPSRHARILEELRRNDDNPSPVVEAISLDPAVSVRVLRMANSAAFGLRRPVDNIRRAVVLLGRRQLESLVIALGVAKAVPRHRVGPLDRRAFWAAATRRAAIARRLAEATLPPRASLAFTAGLISDVAVPLLTGIRPRIYQDLIQVARRDGVELEALERETFGWTHADVVGWLAVEWSLPASLSRLLSTHHDPMPPSRDETGIVRAAALATGTLGVEPALDERGAQATAACWHHLGIAPDTTQRILRERADPNDPLTRVFT